MILVTQVVKSFTSYSSCIENELRVLQDLLRERGRKLNQTWDLTGRSWAQCNSYKGKVRSFKDSWRLYKHEHCNIVTHRAANNDIRKYHNHCHGPHQGIWPLISMHCMSAEADGPIHPMPLLTFSIRIIFIIIIVTITIIIIEFQTIIKCVFWVYLSAQLLSNMDQICCSMIGKIKPLC